MKIPIAILVVLLCYTGSFAQTMQDSLVFSKGLNLIDVANTDQEFEAAGVYFDSLMYAKQDDWLAPLYAALSYLLAAQHIDDGDRIDRLCDKAQQYVDEAEYRKADISEEAAVQAFLYQVRISVNPIERGLDYSKKAETEIKKAEAANPNDPRPYFLYAMNVYYTPKVFGGGAEKALPLFEKAANKFDHFKPSMPFMPHWGEQQNDEMIAKCKEEIE